MGYMMLYGDCEGADRKVVYLVVYLGPLCGHLDVDVFGSHASEIRQSEHFHTGTSTKPFAMPHQLLTLARGTKNTM